MNTEADTVADDGRLVATNGDGTMAGPDQTFSTAPPGGGPGSDTTPPVISSASLAPKLFAVNPKGRPKPGWSRG